MRRRTFLKTAAGAAASASMAGAAQPPNILIITTDQQSSGVMSCRMGSRYLRTPHMDSLAAAGTSFTNAYCANPLCVPSRTSMYTGRYPVETGFETNDAKSPIDHQRFPCMGTVFQRAGYETGYFGKWHIPFTIGQPEVHGFSTAPKMRGDVVTAAATAAFLKTKRSAPFLAVASFLNPHNICEWARGQAMTEGEIGAPPPIDRCPPRRTNYAPPENEADAILLMRRSYQNSKMFPVGGFDEKKWRQYAWAYYRMIELVDARIGQVLEALRESGHERNTLVALTADHGDCQGAHGWNQKTVFYEEAVRVPFILSYKGVTRPGVSDRLVHTGIDLMPTLCAYSGITAPPGLPGLSLKDTADPREYVVVSNDMAQGAPVDGRTPRVTGRMLRTRRYKYCVYSEGARRESLFDLEKDPGEMKNLAGPAYAAVLQHHRDLLAGWRQKFGDR